MSHNQTFWVCLLFTVILAGCTELPTPPALGLSKEYQGRLGEEKGYNESLVVYLTQDGYQVTGEYFFDFRTGIDAVYGKLDGTLQDDQLTLLLRVPPHFIREYSMSPTLTVTLTEADCSKKEAQALVKSLTRSTEATMTSPQLLAGRVVFSAFGEKIDKPVMLLNQPTPDNAFNK